MERGGEAAVLRRRGRGTGSSRGCLIANHPEDLSMDAGVLRVNACVSHLAVFIAKDRNREKQVNRLKIALLNRERALAGLGATTPRLANGQ